MNIINVIRLMNRLKKTKKIADYAIFGAVGASYYIPAVTTMDVDLLVLAQTDADYIKTWRELNKYAEKVMDFGFVIDDTPVQLLPTSVSPIFADALKTATKVKTGGLTTKVVDREHLIVMFLKANRPKDRQKASIMLNGADMAYLEKLLGDFDDTGEIRKRLETLR